jgi:ABC-2 type transport system permease protein
MKRFLYSRLSFLIRKEFIQLSRDKKLVFLMFVYPLLQLLIFGYVFSTDVKHMSLGVMDASYTKESRQLVSSIKSAGYFDVNVNTKERSVLEEKLEHGDITAAVVIPGDFSVRLKHRQTATVQVVIDGSDPNTGGTALSYLNRIIREQSLKLVTIDPRFTRTAQGVDNHINVLYNPDMRSVNYMVPGLIGILLMMVTMLLTSVALVKEREKGTMEQLIVMPLRRYEILLSKLVPFVAIGFFDAVIIAVFGTLWFNVPMRGSVILLFFMSALFVFASLGLGLFVSTVSKTQQQAMMTAYFILLPSMILSGLIFPIESMPTAIQYLTYILHIKYFLIIVRGIFLKGNTLLDLWQPALILAVYGIIVFSLSVARFRKKLT